MAVDPKAVAARLEAAGSRRVFRGLMADRIFDRQGEFAGRDEVVRLRTFRADEGSPARTIIGWKGPVTVEKGAKVRAEIEIEAAGEAEALLRALGFDSVRAIDRYVEVFECRAATVRLEWYPRMDVLVEVEGPEVAIAAAIEVTGIDRQAFTAESLTAFVARYAARGHPPAVALAELGSARPSWDHR